MSDVLELPDGSVSNVWTVKPLSEVTTKIQDGTHFSPSTDDGPYRYVTSKNIRLGRFDLTDCGWISQQEHDSIYARCDVTFGDVLLTKDGANTGNACLNNQTEPFSLLSSVAVLRTDGVSHHAGFILQYLLSPIGQRRLKDLMSGNAIPRLTLRKIKAFSIPVPPSSVQRRIAEILGTVDEVIEQTEALIAKQQQIKAGLMHDLFTRGVSPAGDLRRSAASKTKFGWLPEGWRIGSLLDVARPTRQPILTGPFGADLGNEDFVEQGVPVLRIGNVQASRLDLEDLLFVTNAKARLLERYRVRTGDLLFARQGATTGRNALASEEVDGWLINYHIIRVALDHSRCAPTFIEAAFNGEMVKRQVERDKGRGTREGINSAQLRGLELPLARFEEQQTIARILEDQTSLISSSQTHLAKLRQLKQGLMQDLLTGRVRAPTAD